MSTAVDLSKLHLRSIRSETLLRQALLNSMDITIIGCGAVGSQVARTLSAMGCRSLTLYDHDIVSHENLGPQQWPYDCAVRGTPKVAALKDICLSLNPLISIDALPEKFTSSSLVVTPIVFSCVDHMDVRRDIAAAFSKMWSSNAPSTQLGKSPDDLEVEPLLIDTRMGALALQVLTATPRFLSAYTDTIFPQSEALNAPCTERSTAHCASICAGLAINAYFSHLRGTTPPRYFEFDLFNLLTSHKLPSL